MRKIIEISETGAFVADFIQHEETDPLPPDWTAVPLPQPIFTPLFVGQKDAETGEWSGSWTDTYVEDPAVALSTAKTAAYSRNNFAYDSANNEITKSYPQSEKDSWPTQDREIKAYQADPENALTPWIDTAAQHRGITRVAYIEKTLLKIAQFEQISAYLTGRRQGYEDQIKAALLPSVVNAMTFTYPLG